MPRLETLAASIVGLGLALAPATAAADGIPPSPPCPEGTRTRTCHGPSYCEPAACTTDADCSGGAACRAVSYCILSTYCGGGRPPPDASSTGYPTTSATRFCTEGCAAGETCTPTRVCLPPGSSGGPSHVTYCGCRAAGTGARGVPAGAAALMTVLVLAARRRRERDSPP